MLTDRKVSLANDFPVPYLLLRPGDKSNLSEDPNDEVDNIVYQCPLYGVADRHLTDHQSALLDFVYLKSDIDSMTLLKRGAALLAVNS